MKPHNNDVKCEQERTDCKANREVYCIALDNTKFKRDCPFYKRNDEEK